MPRLDTGSDRRLPLAGGENEREAGGVEQRGVQGQGADDGGLAGLTAAVEQQLALAAMEDFGLPAVNGETAGAKDRAGVERHGHETACVHGR